MPRLTCFNSALPPRCPDLPKRHWHDPSQPPDLRQEAPHSAAHATTGRQCPANLRRNRKGSRPASQNSMDCCEPVCGMVVPPYGLRHRSAVGLSLVGAERRGGRTCLPAFAPSSSVMADSHLWSGPKVLTILTCEACGMNMRYKVYCSPKASLSVVPSHCMESSDKQAQTVALPSNDCQWLDRGGWGVLEPPGAAASPQGWEPPSRHQASQGR